MSRLPPGSDDVDAGVEMSMHYITDDAPELRVDLLRAVLPGYTTLTLTLTLTKCGPATRWWAYPYPYR